MAKQPQQNTIIPKIPQNRDAEKTAIGAAMLEKASAAYLMEKCGKDHFFDPNYRIVFTAMKTAFDDGKTCDYADVASELMRMNSPLGINYLFEEFDFVSSSQSVYGAVDDLREMHTFRKLQVLAQELNKMALSKAGKAKDVIQDAQEKIYELASEQHETDLIHISTGTQELYSKIEDAHKNKGQITGIKTGYSRIDKIMNGLNETVYVLLAARPSMGKSALATCIARNIAKQGIPVGIFSLEMSLQQIQKRLLSIDSRIKANDIRDGDLKDTDWNKLADSFSEFEKYPLFVDDASVPTIEDIAGKVRRAVANHGIKVFFLDHLQLVDTKKFFHNRNDQLGYISKHIKKIAKENNVCMYVLSQLSRAVEKRPIQDRKPVLSDLRESGNLEQDADIVKFLLRWEMYQDHADELRKIPGTDESSIGQANLEIAKNRDGVAHKDTRLYFNAELTEFVQVDFVPEFEDRKPEYLEQSEIPY